MADHSAEIANLETQIKILTEDLSNVQNELTREIIECQIKGRQSDIKYLESVAGNWKTTTYKPLYEVGTVLQGKLLEKTSIGYYILVDDGNEVFLRNGKKDFPVGKSVTVEVVRSSGTYTDVELKQ